MASPLIGYHRSPSTPLSTTAPPVPLQTQLYSSTTACQPQLEGLENAGRLVDDHLKEDASFVELSGQLRIASHTQTNVSGHAEMDYPHLESYFPLLEGLPSVVQKRHIPLPAELLQEFQNLECNCSMGLLPEISRAWLTIDSIVYIWNYVDGEDLAYFDGLNQVVLSVGLVVPKPGVFQPHIQFLLVLTTAVEVVLLGVCFSASALDPQAELHLQPEPLFHLPSDNVGMMCVAGTEGGRIFLGGKDGSLYEVSYQAKEGWFRGKCQLVNHSTSFLSYLVPSFLSFTEEDSLVQLLVDSSRQVLYSRSNSNAISVYDLGRGGCGLSRVAGMSMDGIAQRVALCTRNTSLFKQPLVTLSVLPASESSTLHLLAVTRAGLRLYFTTTPNGINAAPSLLALVHVRLPPGFSSSSASYHVGNDIHQVFYRRGSLALLSAQSTERDSLMFMRPDMFPFQQSLLESYETLNLEGRVWAMAETIQMGELEGTTSLSPLPPAVVTQHAHPPREFVVVGTKGSYLLSCLRPVEQLLHILHKSKGGSSSVVEEFFRLHREAQACAMCLILATGSDQQVAVWATEAFFRFGGEPEMVQPTPLLPEGMLQQPMVGGPPMANTTSLVSPPPSMDSRNHYHSGQEPFYQCGSPSLGVCGNGRLGTSPTQGQIPNFNRTLGGAVVGPEVQLSAKHHGLCRYLARLLRPLWNETLVLYEFPNRDQLEEQVSSKYSPEELGVFLEQILSFKSFFERNPQLLAPPLERNSIESPSGRYPSRLLGHQSHTSITTPTHSFLQHQRSEASLKEYDSTRFLYQLVVRCYECLSLWRLLCEHPFHAIICGLSKDMKQQLKITTFRSLVLSGKMLSTALIGSLLARFSGDASMSGEVSARLRETTPSLFSQNDALSNKASELVSMAASTPAKYEQLNMLRESVKLYCQVTPELSLPAVCGCYQTVQFYEGVLDLCLSAAQQKDPQNFALHFYKSGKPTDDSAGQRAYLQRYQCYSSIMDSMWQLLVKDRTPVMPFSVPNQPGPPSPPAVQDEQTSPPRKQLDVMMTRALHSKDELFHVALYDWMRSVDLSDVLVEIKTPYIERYLKNTSDAEQDSRPILDLLWRYYEKNDDYGAAAKILDQLAHRNGPRITLEERIEYLSRAMLCAKSCNLPTSASHEGEFLHELEEKMEVARIQLSILETLKALSPSSELARAITLLNSELMDITRLYEHFAEKFGLADCKLSIVHCAGHHNPTLIQSLWRDILDSELRSTSSRTSFESVRTKMVHLGSLYARSERFFPKEFLALTLEKYACELSWDKASVYSLLREMGVSLVELFNIYDKLFKAKDPFWKAKEDPLHLLKVICSILLDYVNPLSALNVYERPTFNTCVLTCLSQYLVELPTLPPATPHRTELIDALRSLQKDFQKYL